MGDSTEFTDIGEKLFRAVDGKNFRFFDPRPVAINSAALAIFKGPDAFAEYKLRQNSIQELIREFETLLDKCERFERLWQNATGYGSELHLHVDPDILRAYNRHVESGYAINIGRTSKTEEGSIVITESTFPLRELAQAIREANGGDVAKRSKRKVFGNTVQQSSVPLKRGAQMIVSGIAIDRKKVSEYGDRLVTTLVASYLSSLVYVSRGKGERLLNDIERRDLLQKIIDSLRPKWAALTLDDAIRKKIENTIKSSGHEYSNFIEAFSRRWTAGFQTLEFYRFFWRYWIKKNPKYLVAHAAWFADHMMSDILFTYGVLPHSICQSYLRLWKTDQKMFSSLAASRSFVLLLELDETITAGELEECREQWADFINRI